MIMFNDLATCESTMQVLMRCYQLVLVKLTSVQRSASAVPLTGVYTGTVGGVAQMYKSRPASGPRQRRPLQSNVGRQVDRNTRIYGFTVSKSDLSTTTRRKSQNLHKKAAPLTVNGVALTTSFSAQDWRTKQT